MTSKAKSTFVFPNKSKALITTLCQQLAHLQGTEESPTTPVVIVDLACGCCPVFQEILTKFHDQRNKCRKTQYFGVDKNPLLLQYQALDSVRPSLCLDVLGNSSRKTTLQCALLEGNVCTPDKRLIGADVMLLLQSFFELRQQVEGDNNGDLAHLLFSVWQPHILFIELDCSPQDKVSRDAFEMWSCKSVLKFNYERRNIPYMDADGAKKTLTVFMKSTTLNNESQRPSEADANLYSVYKAIYQVDYPGLDDVTVIDSSLLLEMQHLALAKQQQVEAKCDLKSTDVDRSTWEIVEKLIEPLKDSWEDDEAQTHVLLCKLVERDDPLVTLLSLQRDLTIPFIRIFFETLQMVRKYHILYSRHPRNQLREDKPDIELRRVAERRLLNRLDQLWRDNSANELLTYVTKHRPDLLDDNGKLKALPAPLSTSVDPLGEMDGNSENNKENKVPAEENMDKGDELSSEELEMNVEVLDRRQRSLDVVKEGEHYIHYLCALPKSQREVYEPKTPNKFHKMSRRNWDARIRTWRIRVHDWCRDKPSLNLAGGDCPK